MPKRQFRDLFKPLNEPESHVDPFTNLAVLSEIDVEQHISVLLKRQLPRHCYCPFVHELTHHWCFHSPVGAALAIQYLRARRHAYLLKNKQGDYWELVNFLIRYVTTIEMLRPLAEGLALFAEFDFAPGRSRIGSPIWVWTGILFLGESTDNYSRDIDDEMRKFLAHLRVSPDLCRRKANLLVQPMGYASNGYLAGYLTVKNLWFSAMAKAGQFRDPDFFLTYMRNFIYNDYEFVRTILNPWTNETEAVNEIKNYLPKRLDKILTEDLEASAAEFEESEPPITFGVIPDDRNVRVLLGDAKSCQYGKEMLKKAFEEIANESRDCRIPKGIATADAWLLTQREVMCLGNTSAYVRVAANGHVIATRGDKVLVSTPGLEGIKKGQGDGTVGIFLSPSVNYLALTVSLGNELVWLRFPAPDRVEERMKKIFLGYCVNRQFLEKLVYASQWVVDYFAKYQPNALKGFFEDFEKDLLKGIEDFYSHCATLRVRDENLGNFKLQTREYGFWNILFRDGELIRGLALLGLLSSILLPWVHQKFFLVYGMDYQTILNRLRESEKKHGFPFLTQRHNGLSGLI